MFNRYASLLIALMAGITVMSGHQYGLYIAVGLMIVAGLWANGLLFGEDEQ